MKGEGFRFLGVVSSMLGLSLGLAGVGHAEMRGAQKNVPHWAVPEQRVESASDGQRVTITAYLSFCNQGALKDLVAAQSAPSSMQYGKYLTPEQFHAEYSPKAADVQRVQRTLERLGFLVVYTPDSGLFVSASGTVAQVKAAFGVSQDLYAYKGKILRANAETPRIPAAISDVVTFVAGLDQMGALRTPHHIRMNERPSTAASPASAAARVANSAVAPNA